MTTAKYKCTYSAAMLAIYSLEKMNSSLDLLNNFNFLVTHDFVSA